MGWGAASSTVAVRGAYGMDVLGRVPSGRRQVAWAELGKDMDCSWHVGVRCPGAVCQGRTMLLGPTIELAHRVCSMGALSLH